MSTFCSIYSHCLPVQIIVYCSKPIEKKQNGHTGRTWDFYIGGLYDLALGHREGLYSEIWRVYIGKDNKFKSKGGVPVTQLQPLVMPMP